MQMFGEYENSSSERMHFQKSRQTASQNGKINNDVVERTIKNEAYKKQVQELQKLIGNGKYVVVGTKDRLLGKPNDEDNPLYKDDKVSYHYGYLIRGSRAVLGEVWKLEHEGKYEEAKAIGYREYHLGITEDNLNGLVDCQGYMEGYNIAKKESVGRGR